MSRPRCAMALLLQVAAAVWFWSTAGVGALWLSVPASGTKCVSEEMHANVVVLADYTAIYAEQSTELPTVSTKVTSPYGNTIFHQENATTGHFAFTTTESGTYLACFWIDNLQNKKMGASLNLEWRTGIAAKDWDSVAKKEKIEGVELELKKLEGAVELIHENLLFLRDREAEMRIVSEKTNARVAWFSIMSLGVCIVASVLQLWHLTTFFQKKKLI